ncbi:MAG: 2-dehydropantoate 2-reductase [Candidatus Omnitrophota bacterium]
MKVVIIGPGAMGTLFAAFFARAKHEVWLLDKSTERTQKIRKSGICVEGLSKIEARVNSSTQAQEVGTADAVFVCVKSQDTEEALKKSVNTLLKENTFVVTLQNGLGNIQVLNDLVGEERVLAGVTSQAATYIEPGCVRHAGEGETIIGRVNKDPLGQGRAILELLNKSGIATRTCRDIHSLVWSKLVINAGINALSAITRLPNGTLLEYPFAKELLRAAVSEAVRVAKKKRIKLTYDDPIQKVESVCRLSCANFCSMLQDILHRRQTEIDFINGAIVRQGKELGIATPVNEVLTHLIKTIEASYAQQIQVGKER